MQKYLSVIFISIFTLLSLYWLFLYDPKLELPVLHVQGLKVRKVTVLKPMSTIPLKEKSISINLLGEFLYLLPYSEEVKYLYKKIDLSGKEIMKMDVDEQSMNQLCYGIKNFRDNSLLLCQSDTLAKLISCNKNGDKKTQNFNWNGYSGIDFDDSCIVYVKQNEKEYFLIRYNYVQKLADSLEINTIFNSQEEVLNVVYGARIAILDSQILFKLLHSSFGLIIDRDMKQYRVIQALDSLPLPVIKQTKLAEGIYSSDAFPNVISSMQIFKHKDMIYNLSWLSKDPNVAYVDLYDGDFNYQKSFELSFLYKKFRPYCFQVSADGKLLYVLYDDYLSIQTFNLNS